MGGLRRGVELVGQLVAETRRPTEARIPGRQLWRIGAVALSALIVAINLVGAAAVLAIELFVMPEAAVLDEARLRTVNLVAFVAYVVFAVPVGAFVGIRAVLRLRVWLFADRPATPAERRLVLRAPLRLFVVQVVLWFGAAVVFGVLNTVVQGGRGATVAASVTITGLVTASCAYLFTERVMRAVASRALHDAVPARLAVPGVATRAVLAWAIGSGLPTAGLVALAVTQLAGGLGATADELAVASLVLGGVGLGVGSLAVVLAARATADPIDEVRKALAEVERGQFDVQVPVYDGTQVGQLQLGFNRMVVGLAEREAIRDALGTYVDPEVAKRILTEGTSLAGEEVEVTVLFVDIRDFTGFAERTPAPEVVAAVNALFERVVPVVHEHGGRVDKFIGDGVMAVFGAPRRLDDHAGAAVAAAVEIERCVREADVHGLRVGIGANSGFVVAGNVGGAGRLEFSVIGDAVNIAARVESATRQTGDAILVGQRTAELLGDRYRLEPRPAVRLKGKRDDVAVLAVLPS